MKAVLLFLAGFLVGACTQPAPKAPEQSSSTDLAQDLAAKTVAFVHRRADEGAKAYCSGVWVGDATILTAAHCLAGEPDSALLHYVIQDDVLDGVKERAKPPFRVAELSRLDEEHDLALFRAAAPLPVHRVAKPALGSIVLGQRAITMGHPLGLFWSWSAGEIAAIRVIDLDPEIVYVQTTAPTSRGNSGCGLFDEQGGLMGIAHAGMPSGSNLAFYVHAQYVADLLRR